MTAYCWWIPAAVRSCRKSIDLEEGPRLAAPSHSRWPILLAPRQASGISYYLLETFGGGACTMFPRINFVLISGNAPPGLPKAARFLRK
jgi:hypothetical protein